MPWKKTAKQPFELLPLRIYIDPQLKTTGTGDIAKPFKDAGITRVEFVSSPISNPQKNEVNVYLDSRELRDAFKKEALGETIGNTCRIFVNRIGERYPYIEPRVITYAIMHEIGHVAMNSQYHDPSGEYIMVRAVESVIRLLEAGIYPPFSEQSAQKMRRNLGYE